MKLIQKHYFLSIFILCTLVTIPFYSNAFAQNEDEEGMVVEDLIQPVEDEYQIITLRSLSKLYWAIGKFDLTDTRAVSNYLLINECDLYTQYYNDDLEWRKVQEAARDYLSKNMSHFSTKFEMVVPITLDRYDIENQKFMLDEKVRLLMQSD